jgi:hypothetical protein
VKILVLLYFWVDFGLILGVDFLGKPVELWEILSSRKILVWLSWGVCREVGCDDLVVLMIVFFFFGWLCGFELSYAL